MSEGSKDYANKVITNQLISTLISFLKNIEAIILVQGGMITKKTEISTTILDRDM